MTGSAVTTELAAPAPAPSRQARPHGGHQGGQEPDSPRTNGTAASTVVRVDLGPSQWALVVQPADRRVPDPPAFAGPFVASLPRRIALVRIPGPADPHLGLAVLLYCRGRTQICCPENHITDGAAAVLSALAGRALQAALDGRDANGGTADPEPRMTVTRVEHSLLPTDHRHIASAEVRGRDVTFSVCSFLISAELADVLGLLCTAYVRNSILSGRRARAAGTPAWTTPAAETRRDLHAVLACPKAARLALRSQPCTEGSMAVFRRH